MFVKNIAVFAFISMASAGLLPIQQVYHQSPEPHATLVKSLGPVPHTTLVQSLAPAIYATHAQTIATHHDAQYNFAYEVHDEHTGDIKRHSEERKGDIVQGEYSLIDADGFRRVVQYTVDPHSGFNAVVNRIPLEHSKTIVKQVAPVTYVAPAHPAATVVQKYPVAYQQHY